MDGAILEARLPDEVLAFHRVERQLLVAGDAERHQVTRDSALEVFGRPLGDDPSIIDDGYAVTKGIRFVQVVRRQEHSRPTGMHAPHLVPDASPALWIQAGRRLVEKQQLGSVDEAEADVESSLLTTRVGADLAVGRPLELEHLDQLGRAFLRSGAGHAVEAALEDKLGAAS